MSGRIKLTESAEHDMYIAQLKEVFDSCDQTGSSTLNRHELLQLCDKLQLEDQSEYLVNELLRDKSEACVILISQQVKSLHTFIYLLKDFLNI